MARIDRHSDHRTGAGHAQHFVKCLGADMAGGKRSGADNPKIAAVSHRQTRRQVANKNPAVQLLILSHRQHLR